MTRFIAVTVNSNNTFTINHDVQINTASPSEEYSVGYDPNNGFIYYGYRWNNYYFYIVCLYIMMELMIQVLRVLRLFGIVQLSYGYGTKIAICPVTGNVLYFYGADTSSKTVSLKVLETFTHTDGNLRFRDIRTPDLTYISNSTLAQYTFNGINTEPFIPT